MHASRRRFLGYGLAGLAAAAAVGLGGAELISRGDLPGKGELDAIDGACTVAAPDLTPYAPPGPQVSGTFYSQARNCAVGYTIGYPPGHRPGAELSLVVMLHGFGGSHVNALFGLSPAQALALKVGRMPLPPMALVTVDGGNGYWKPHPGDNPQAMLTDELIPLCAAGFGDPFYPGVKALARALPKRTGGEPPVVSFSGGCHDSSFFTSQEPPSLAFLARRLTPSEVLR